MARRGYEDEGEVEVAPWLAAADVEPDARHMHVPKNRLIWWIGLVAVLLVLVVALIYASVAKPDNDGAFLGADGQPPLIQAPDTPYKVRPAQAGGLDLEGVGQTAYEAADGVDPGGDLDLSAMPEEPMARPVASAAPVSAPGLDAEADIPAPVTGPKSILPLPAPPKPTVIKPAAGASAPLVPKPTPPVAKPVPPVAKPALTPKDRLADVEAAVKAANKTAKTAPPVAAPGSGGTVLQLGAFSTEAKAKAAWKTFASRYAYLGALEQSIVPLERDGATLYRLRATGAASHGQAADLCARLKVAGEQCSVTE